MSHFVISSSWPGFVFWLPARRTLPRTHRACRGIIVAMSALATWLRLGFNDRPSPPLPATPRRRLRHRLQCASCFAAYRIAGEHLPANMIYETCWPKQSGALPSLSLPRLRARLTTPRAHPPPSVRPDSYVVPSSPPGKLELRKCPPRQNTASLFSSMFILSPRN